MNDVAHALSLCNRFAGHTAFPISVAQHSVFVSLLCTGTGFELQGLLHDASEAYLGDVTKWLKESPQMRAYRSAEDRLQSLIYERYGCPTVMSDVVDEADRLMVRFEFEMAWDGRYTIGADGTKYGPVTDDEHELINSLPIKWRPMRWNEAKALFIAQFDRLT